MCPFHSKRHHFRRGRMTLPSAPTAPSSKNPISFSVCSANHRFIAVKLLVQLPTELTPISLVALLSLGDRVGFGVGDAVGVGVRLLRLPLSLVPLVELVSLVRGLCHLLVLCFPPILWFLLRHLSVLLISNPPTGSSDSQSV